MAVLLRPDEGWLRALRAVVVVTAAVELAVAAHLVLDGCVDVTAVALVTALCVPSGWLLARREVSVPLLAGWLLGVQLAAHLLLSALCRGSVLLPSPSVLLAHLAAVAAAGLLLRRAEACVWTAAAWRRAARWVLVLLRPVPAAAPRRAAVPHTPTRPRRTSPWTRRALGRRGPPVGAAAS